MFMFWSKRAVLTRRLLKAKVRGEHETECETQEDTLSRYNVTEINRITHHQQQQPSSHHHQRQHHENHLHQQHQQRGSAESQSTRGQKSSPTSSSSSNSSSTSYSACLSRASVATRFHQGCCGGDISHDEDDELVRVEATNQRTVNAQTSNRMTRCKELLKSLKENQLEMLLNVVESYGTEFGACVLVPRKQQHHQHHHHHLHHHHHQQEQRVQQRETARRYVTHGGGKQQETSCNRRQRCPLLATSNENSTRRPAHRHVLRSRRHNPGSRCTRCVNAHATSEDNAIQQRAEYATTCFNEDEDDETFATAATTTAAAVATTIVNETRDNETNLRLIEDTRTQGNEEQTQRTLWINDREDIDDSSLIPNDPNARPERDRCRRHHGKAGRSTVTRKRRESPSNGDNLDDYDRCYENSHDQPLDDPHVLSCQTWRWPDLANSAELKKLPVCHSSKDPVSICCNPYHWSRLCKPESPPPPYCLIPDRLRPEDRAPSEISGDYRRCGIATSPQPHSGSLTTNGEGGNEMGQKEWCTLAYWELGGRVGRLYPVEPSTVNVFDTLHDGDGLCLSTLAENHAASPAVLRTRSKIGLGLMLSQESDGVWAYNRSESPIFVNSPTLDDPESRTLLVYRVPPGFCLNIFDRSKTMKLQSSSRCCHGQSASITAGSFNSGPVDVNSVRISFAKGWGPKYSRQEVTSCPCWLEVLLAPCR